MTAPPQPEPAKPDPPKADALGQRVDALESGQSTIEGKVDQILGILGKDGTGSDSDVTRADPPAPQITPDMMADAVRKVNAERDAAAAKATPEPEKTPAEVGLPLRARVARALYGKDPKLWAAATRTGTRPTPGRST
jgi:hypothetical protein